MLPYRDIEAFLLRTFKHLLISKKSSIEDIAKVRVILMSVSMNYIILNPSYTMKLLIIS